MADTAILDGQDIGRAQRAAAAVLGTVLAEHDTTTFDRRVELTAAGRVVHGTPRSALDHVTGELCSGIPEADLAAAPRVLAEVAWRADGRMQLWVATQPAEPAR